MLYLIIIIIFEDMFVKKLLLGYQIIHERLAG